MKTSEAIIVGAVSMLAVIGIASAQTNAHTDVNFSTAIARRVPSEFESEPPIVEFLFNGHLIPKTRAEMRRKYGKPSNIKVQAPAPEDGSYNTVTYPGAVVTYYEFRDGGGHVYDVAISSPGYPVMWELGVGASTKTVEQRLGTPSGQTAEVLNYSVMRDGDAAGEVTFNHRNGKVTEVLWSVILD